MTTMIFESLAGLFVGSIVCIVYLAFASLKNDAIFLGKNPRLRLH